MIEILSIFFSIFLSSLSKSIMDKLSHHYDDSAFSLINKKSFWFKWFNDPDVSYANKYKDVKTLEPKFFGATWFAVCITDAWHFFGMTYRICFMGLVLIYGIKGFVFNWYIDIASIITLHAIFFHCIYHYIFSIKFWEKVNKMKFLIMRTLKFILHIMFVNKIGQRCTTLAFTILMVILHDIKSIPDNIHNIFYYALIILCPFLIVLTIIYPLTLSFIRSRREKRLEKIRKKIENSSDNV